MLDLSQAGPDSDHSSETESLTFIDHNDPKTIRLMAKPQNAAQAASKPTPIVDTPIDLFIIVSNYISFTDFLCVLLASKSLKDSRDSSPFL